MICRWCGRRGQNPDRPMTLDEYLAQRTLGDELCLIARRVDNGSPLEEVKRDLLFVLDAAINNKGTEGHA